MPTRYVTRNVDGAPKARTTPAAATQAMTPPSPSVDATTFALRVHDTAVVCAVIGIFTWTLPEIGASLLLVVSIALVRTGRKA